MLWNALLQRIRGCFAIALAAAAIWSTSVGNDAGHGAEKSTTAAISSPVAPHSAVDRRIAAAIVADDFAAARREAESITDAALKPRRLERIAKIERRRAEWLAAAEAVAKAESAAAEKPKSPRGESLPDGRPAPKKPSSSGDAKNAASKSKPLPGRNTEPGGFGGDNEPDFESIIELVTSVVEPQSWDGVGGAGSVKGFANGIYVDAQGVLHRIPRIDDNGSLTVVRSKSPATDAPPGDVRHASPLRKVSLTRLERALASRKAAGRGPDESMRFLAGLQRIQYILVYPPSTSNDGLANNAENSGEIVLAGPAGAWRDGPEQRVVSADTGRPVLRLDDLVVVLRHLLGRNDATFGCSITPTEKGLAAVKQFVDESAGRKLAAGDRAREKWLAGLKSSLGPQDVDVYGIDPGTRVARVLVEADYRMKLVGLGLEESVLGVPNYMDSVRLDKNGQPPPLDVLRWWFTLRYDAVRASADGLAFELKGQGVQLLSENQFLESTGKRQSTGGATLANAEFAHDFTRHFAALAGKYPVYAELQNLCDMALAGALIKTEKLREKSEWSMDYLGDAKQYSVPTQKAPKKVDTIIAHRVLDGKHVVAAVSGGVRIETARIAASKPETIKTAELSEKRKPRPTAAGGGQWWWD